jgi:3-hydroxyacyl-CoA dehydrogenase
MVGRAWAAVLARAGHEVRLFDEQPGAAAAAIDEIDRMLALYEEGGLLGDVDRASTLAMVHPTQGLAEAVAAAQYVQECVPEVVELKAAVTSAIAELAPPAAILASSTSGLVPSSFSAEAQGRERCLVVHPINPVHLHSLVEVVPAPWTADDVVLRAVALLHRAGLEPVRLNREVDGFLVNRLQGALLQEAFRLVAEGVATAADIDTAVRSGLAPRWSFMGPFETIDLNAPDGIADYVERYSPMYRRLASQQTEVVDWAAALESGLLEQRRTALPLQDLPDRRAWRDQELLDFLIHRNRNRISEEATSAEPAPPHPHLSAMGEANDR